MKGIRILLACIRKADTDFNLINDGDRIVIGVSGGKDSMALLYSLHLYQKFSKAKFDIYPCMIDLGFPHFDASKIEEYCASLGYKLEILKEPQVFEILKIQKEKQKLNTLPCSICSRMKKAIINKYAERIKANKVSFAHHKDDALETLLLNEIYGGRIATFSPKMFLSNDELTFIRPFIYVKEKDIIKTIKEENIPIFKSMCPNDKKTKREDIKLLLNNIYRNYPSSEDNFLLMLSNKDKVDVFYNHEEHKIDGTSLFYKRVNTKEDLIEYLKYLNFNIKNDLNNFLYLIYNKDKLVGVSSIKKIKEREYELEFIDFINKEDEVLFIKDYKKELFNRFNPCMFNGEILKNNGL